MEIQELLEEVKSCKKCSTICPWVKFPINSHGNINSKNMIVSEAPGKKSIDEGAFWKGQAGKRIRKSLSIFNIKLEDLFYLTDIVKCWPKMNNSIKNRTPNDTELNNCKFFLNQEISIIKPNIIIVFGKTPLSYFLDNFKLITKFDFNNMNDVQNDNGYHILEFEKFKLIPLLHPSRANRFMDYGIYRKHLQEIFKIVINNKTSNNNL